MQFVHIQATQGIAFACDMGGKVRIFVVHATDLLVVTQAGFAGVSGNDGAQKISFYNAQVLRKNTNANEENDIGQTFAGMIAHKGNFMQQPIDPSVKERFDAVWQQIEKNNAVLFLRHALRLDMSLQQLLQALEYRNVHELLAEVRLSDILVNALRQNQAPATERRATPTNKVAKARRKRRGADEINQLRDTVLDRMRSAMGSVTTSHLCDVLNNGGFDVDLLQMNRLLNALEQQGYVTCLGGKPKAWRLKPQGRTAPEPMVVRKGGSAEAPSSAAS